jgi:amino acid permease
MDVGPSASTHLKRLPAEFYHDEHSLDGRTPLPSAGQPIDRRQNSAWVTAGILTADVVGAGILSMAVAVSRFGWLLGTVVVLVVLLMNMHITMFLWRLVMKYPSATTLIELTRAVLAGGAGGAGAKLVAVLQYVFLFDILGIYSLTAGKALGMIFYDTEVLTASCIP